jgi:malate dehydrogenase
MVNLYLQDILPMEDSMKGLQAELHDSAFPLIGKITVTSNKDIAFRDADYVFLVGAKAREPAFKERKELVIDNSIIY